MKPLPILISVPHAGLKVPDSVKELSLLTEEQIRVDGDEGAAEIYDFEGRVHYFIKADIARAFVDLNRAPTDHSRDGVVKTHTCQMAPVYKTPLNRTCIRTLLESFYYPYHAKLTGASLSDHLFFGVDCHTMAETAPQIAPDYGKKRPLVCLSNAGVSCPKSWLEILAEEFEYHLGVGTVGINKPFKGGYTVNKHSLNLNWIQLEISREGFADNRQKREVVFDVINRFFEKHRTRIK